MKRRPSQRKSREAGQSMLETALMLVVIFIVVFWIIEVCGMIYTFATISNAAEEGVRYGITRSGVATDDSQVVSRVRSFAQASMHDVSSLNVSVTLPDGDNKPPHRLRVTVTYSYLPWIRSVATPPSMHAYSEGTIVVQ